MQNSIVKKSLVVGIILLFSGMSITTSIGNKVVKKSTIPLSKGNTLYVGGTGEGNYTKIQDAIYDANNGDTVFVYNNSSPYYENIVVNKSINLIGENKDTTEIISNGDANYVLDISVDFVNISGFTILSHWVFNYYGWGGISLGSCNNNISGNIIKGFIDEMQIGIEVSDFSNNNILTRNIIFDHRTGIYLSDSSNNLIKNNNFSGNWVSIKAYDSNNNIIMDNNLPYNVHGIILQENCMNNTITGNTLLNTSCCTGIGIEFSSNNNTVSNNTIISGGWCGIIIQYSKDNTVIGNTIINWSDGIYLWDSSYNTIMCNNIINCYWHGIATSTPLINEYGIHRKYSICDNINSNNLSQNSYGRLYFYSSNNNIIHHNNLINNIQNAYDGWNNTWDNDYPSGGNFWDDYNGTDADGDGIGDTPYPIPGGDNEDRYPLMEPYGNFNFPPIAKFIWTPTHPDPGETILFNASKSIDYDGNITLYEWDWDDDGIFDENHTNPTATHIFDEIGYYQVILKVTDNNNLTNSKTKKVRVGNLAPQASNITGPSYGKPGVEYTFCIDVIDPEGDQIYCMWNWGDGTTSEWLGPYNSGTTICASHNWSEEGVYEIKIKLKDEYGTESDWSEPHIIIIDGNVPKVDITKPSRAIYIKDRRIIPFIVPVIFGDIQIWFWAEDSLSGLNRTELYINNDLKGVFTIIPKSWTWNETTPLKYRYVIKLIAYDNAGNNATKKITVWRFF